jgi:hypothetical protein
LLDKLKNACKKLGDFFTGLFNLASYTEHQRAINTTLTEITKQMSTIADGLKTNTTATNTLTGKIDTM